MAKQRPLTHQETEQRLSAYRDLSPLEKAAVADHLATCQRCTIFAEQNHQMDLLLKKAARQQPDPSLAANFYKTIETDGRSWFQTASQFTNQFAGIALLLVVVVSTWLVIRSGSSSTTIGTPTPTPLPIATPDRGPSLQPIHTFTQTVSLFALSPESSYLATTDNNSIKIWNPATGASLISITEQADSIESLMFTPNGVSLIGRDNSGQFHRWLAYNGNYQRTFKGPQTSLGTPFAVSNTKLVIVTAENNLEVWSLVGERPDMTIEMAGEPITSIAISADGQSVAAVSQDGSVAMLDTDSKKLMVLSDVPEAISGLVFTNDGRQFATFHENTIQLWRENSIQHELFSSPEAAASGDIDTVLFASQDQFLIVSYSGRFLEFWDVNTGQRVKVFNSSNLPAQQTAIGLTRTGFLYLTLHSPDSLNFLTVWEKPEE